MAVHETTIAKLRTLIACFAMLILAASCSKSGTSPLPSRSTSSTSADIEIQLTGGVESTTEIDLFANDPSTRSFSSNEAVGRNVETSVSYCYTGEINLTNAYDLSDTTVGHVIAFKICHADPKNNDITFSKTVYGVFKGKEVVAFDGETVRIIIRPRVPEVERVAG